MYGRGNRFTLCFNRREIKNKGTRNTRLKFPEKRRPFSVSLVEFKEDGEQEFLGTNRYGTPVATPLKEKSPSSVVRAGGIERIPFVFRVASAGLYFLVFSVPVPEEEKQLAKKLGFRYGANWVAKKFFFRAIDVGIRCNIDSFSTLIG